jgi:hypothetical protein
LARIRPWSDAEPLAADYRSVMGTNSRNPIALGALVLVLCALVAATFDGPRWTDLQRQDDRPAAGQEERPADQREAPAAEDSQSPQNDDEPWLPWVPPLDLLLLVPAAMIFGVALLVIARLRLVRRRRRLTGRFSGRSTPHSEAEPPPDEDVESVPDALDEVAHAIGEGSPRNAIVAAWVRLEQAVESERFPHRPEETPSELVERALSSYQLDDEAIRRLAALYREARFSAHPVTEQHRVEATECLRRLLATLGSGAAR